MIEDRAEEALKAAGVAAVDRLDTDFVTWCALSPYTNVEAAALSDDAADVYAR